MSGIKNTKKISIIAVSIILIIGLFFASAAEAGLYTGGMWGQYSFDNFNDHRRRVFDSLRIEGLNHPNFSAHLNNVIGQPNNAYVVWRGMLLADVDGVYNFRVDVLSERYQLYINSQKLFLVPPNFHDVGGDRSINVNLTAGWHKFTARVAVRNVANAQFQVFWTPPGGAEEPIPIDHLNQWHWSNSIVTIPSTGSERVDFVTTGTGVDGEVRPEIEINLPAPMGDILTDEVVLIWFKRTGEPDDIIVNNEITGALPEASAGTAFEAIYHDASGPVHYSYRQMHARLPQSLIDDGGTGRLHLSFEKLPGAAIPTFVEGLVLFVPFRNPALPQAGTLTLRMMAASAYHGMSPVMTFPVNGGTVIDPVFVFEDGETKRVSIDVPPRYRPNYLHMLTGSGSQLSIDTILKDQPGAQMILPEATPLDINNPDTFYPDYGREGPQIDTISSKYVPNLWATTQAQYKNQQEGLINPINVPAGETWIAFQYIGSNFAADGVDGSGESGSIACIGMFTTTPLEHNLDVTVSGAGTVTSDPAGINCPGDCDEIFPESTVVELTATPSGGSSFLGWTGDCSGLNPICYIVMDRAQSVGANFSLDVPGKCGHIANRSACLEPQGGFCAPFNIMSNYTSTGGSWSWRCTGTDGSFVDCNVQRRCGWIESK